MSGGRQTVRIAHAYGNSRPALAAVLESMADVIEVDIWFRGSGFEARHERRLGPLPLLFDSVMVGHQPGPQSLRFGRYYVRPDRRSLSLEELLRRVGGRKRLLLDVKGRQGPAQAERLATALIEEVRHLGAESWVSVCGQTFSALDALRRRSAPFPVRYSIERLDQWDAFFERAREDESVRAACVNYRFLTAERLESALEAGVDVYGWTVDEYAVAQMLVASGVSGIISNNLAMLAELP